MNKCKIWVAGTAMIMLGACSKESNQSELSSAAVQTINEVASTEMSEEEIFSSINTVTAAFQTNKLKSTSLSTDCAKITIKPIIGGYPKTITIDYGTGCTGTRGITRSGVISFSISDSLRTPGAKINANFLGFSVNGFSVNGTMSFENTSKTSVPAFYQETNLVMTTAQGVTITKIKTANRQWIAGSSTPEDVSDDIFQITASANISSSSAGSYNYQVIEPIVIAASCDMFREGVVEITTPKASEPITVDFGDGQCDLKVLVSEGKQISNKVVNLSH